jgi:hypothetical protein
MSPPFYALLLRDAPLGRKPEITKVDRDQLQVANWFQIWSAHVRKALGWIAETLYLQNVVDILRGREATRYINVVVVSAKEEIVAEVEVLLFAVASDFVWKTHAQPAPKLTTFLPRRDFCDREAGHCPEEWRG